MEASIALPGSVMAVAGSVLADGSVVAGGRHLRPGDFEWRTPVTGAVYGVILNDRPTWEAWGAAMAQPPYKAPPQAPVLFIKPRNTHAASGARVAMPAGADRLDLGAQLGILFERTATRVGEAEALEAVAGYVPVIDLSIPHAAIHRPAIREKCFDGACPIGPCVVPRERVADPAGLVLRTRVDGALVAERKLDDLLRPVARLIADVTEFMSLLPGDLLLAGGPLALPQAGAGARVSVELAAGAEVLASVECLLAGEAP